MVQTDNIQNARLIAHDIIEIKKMIGEMYVNRIAPAHRPAEDDVDSFMLQHCIDVLINAANHILTREGLAPFRVKIESNCSIVSASDALERLAKSSITSDVATIPHQPFH